MNEYYTTEQLQRIEKTKVCIAGCGGLGSNVAHLLVRSGFKKFLLIDCDRVEESNLNRQFYFLNQVGVMKAEALNDNLKKIRDDISIDIIIKRLKSFDDIKDQAADCDIFVEAFDTPESKAVFVNGAIASGKPVIAASGIAGYGNSDDIVIKKIKDNLYIVGDGCSDIKSRPPLAPRVNVAAAKQADIVLELTLGK